MERSYQILFEILYEKYSINEIVEMFEGPLRIYERDMLNYPVLDIGLGLGIDSIHFAKKGHKVFAVDNDDVLIKLFEIKIKEYEVQFHSKLDIEILNQSYPNIIIPETKLSLIIASNLFHFFDIETVRQSIIGLDKYLVQNSMIYIQVHSVNHPSNDLSKGDERFKHFKHYFKKEEVINLFYELNYDTIYVSEYNKLSPYDELNITKEWCVRQFIEFKKYKREDSRIQSFVEKNVKLSSEQCIIVIMRKK
ncbi:MAG: class I SAM-dependent methyltransferase [Saprospiraceae bacterium]|uniref:Class I SAM-dependent methyltransferase n=1 Tax=Candidatus Opimibacter skivensis TaxID=2982028 RepID=A0A9D7SXU3_9BACT|nr:class I SAM-dependent methyltransferase [Candidatus Opimibacter skivensis]